MSENSKTQDPERTSSEQSAKATEAQPTPMSAEPGPEKVESTAKMDAVTTTGDSVVPGGKASLAARASARRAAAPTLAGPASKVKLDPGFDAVADPMRPAARLPQLPSDEEIAAALAKTAEEEDEVFTEPTPTGEITMRPPAEELARRKAAMEKAAGTKPVLTRVAQVLLAIFYPLVLLVLAIRLVTSSVYLWIEYHRPGFPADSFGFSTDDRITYGSYTVDYHSTALNFHTGLASDHPYKANAWSWLVMGRPTSYYVENYENGDGGCPVDKCTAAITSLGNPLIWWGGTLALLFLVGVWIAKRDWRAGAILCGFAAGFVPWLFYPERTIFFFYAIAYEPFMILAIVMVLGMVMGKPADPPWRRQQGALFAGIFVVVAVALSAYFYPLWSAEMISQDYWRQHMWLPSWI